MLWHEHWRARNAAKTLSKHRKSMEREAIRETTRKLCLSMGREIPEALRG